jgi:3-oxoacyl-[acyl-carrier protein] reductase
VNAVAFGFIDTRLTAPSDGGSTIERGGHTIKLGIPQHMRELATTIIPLGRAGTPGEAAGAIFVLCSPWSNFVQGQVLTVNGGQMTGMTS